MADWMSKIDNKKIQKILQEDPILKEIDSKFMDKMISEKLINGWNPNQTKQKVEWIETLTKLSNLKENEEAF
jgi:hypothetical protein